MSVTSARIIVQMTVVEVPTTSSLLASRNSTVTHEGKKDNTLTATTTPDVEETAFNETALVAGALTLDLTSLSHQLGGTKTAAGKKLRGVYFENKSTNAGNMRIKTGAAAGHLPVGSQWDFNLAPGDTACFYYTAAADVTNASNDTIDIAGTGTDTLKWGFVWG